MAARFIQLVVQGFLVPTCLLTVMGALMVPYTGVQRPIAGRVVRISLFSGQSFVSNVHNVQASPVSVEGPSWAFDKTVSGTVPTQCTRIGSTGHNMLIDMARGFQCVEYHISEVTSGR
eukprot:jgi/Mesvir1/9369/Mv07861-RA.1